MDDAGHGGDVGAEPPEAVKLRALVGPGVDIDVVAGLFQQASERGWIFAAVELVAEPFTGGELRA